MVTRDVLASPKVFDPGFVIRFCFSHVYDVWVLFLLRFSTGFFLLMQDSLISLEVLHSSFFFALSLYFDVEMKFGELYLASSIIVD